MPNASNLTASMYLELEFKIQFSYRPATPDVHYLPNGDPGHPGDPEVIEVIEVALIADPKPGSGKMGLRVPLTNPQIAALQRHIDFAVQSAIADYEGDDPEPDLEG